MDRDPNEDAAIGECFDASRPLGERLRETADIIDGPAWLDQLLHRAAVVIEARDRVNAEFVRGLADMHEAARADVDRLRGVLKKVESLFKKTRRSAEAANSLVCMVEMSDVVVLEVLIEDALAATAPKEEA